MIDDSNEGIKVILQGLNQEALDIKSGDEKFEKIKQNIKKIQNAVDEIEEVKRERHLNMWDSEVKKFSKITKSKTIKKALKERHRNLHFSIVAMIDANIDKNTEEIMELFKEEKDNIYKLSNKDIKKKQIKEISKDWFGKEYNFSLEDLKELTDWQVDIASWLVNLVPSSVTALCFTDYTDNLILQQFENFKSNGN